MKNNIFIIFKEGETLFDYSVFITITGSIPLLVNYKSPRVSSARNTRGKPTTYRKSLTNFIT